eukprot:CAMPEP_0170167840 /NCGR_PEP_ID=MMETSP0040_2-20121228/1121_1 /TAXON_ID=641309 /ORGANISM="Lotharella oceanica, Strain CCMP622" /LENGTH=131 /DNA_ID=CAMNT_0010405977 /DNA_START=36 /DNA_END=431 /DNA_ORIENTATION=+
MINNRLEPSAHYLLDDEERKIEFKEDEKQTSCGVFTVNKEDHTFGNITRIHLLMDKRVLFAGYRIPHPLYAIVKMKIRTTTETTPIGAMESALTNASSELQHIADKFNEALRKYEEENKAAGAGSMEYADL